MTRLARLTVSPYPAKDVPKRSAHGGPWDFVSRTRICIFLWLCIIVGCLPCRAEDELTCGEYGWHSSGLLCYRIGTSKIRLLKFDKGSVRTLFEKDMGAAIKLPLCLNDAVIAVSADGLIRKFDFSGGEVFKKKIEGFEGAAGHCGRLINQEIFVTSTQWAPEKQTWKHILYTVDVSSLQPQILSESEIIEPVRVTNYGEEIIIIGERETQRVNVKQVQKRLIR